jgi:hypothetical protein
MEQTFEPYWNEDGQFATTWTNALLGPPPPHVLQLLGAGGQNQQIAHRFVNGFDNPRDYFDWFMAPDLAERYLAEVTAAD